MRVNDHNGADGDDGGTIDEDWMASGTGRTGLGRRRLVGAWWRGPPGCCCCRARRRRISQSGSPSRTRHGRPSHCRSGSWLAQASTTARPKRRRWPPERLRCSWRRKRGWAPTSAWSRSTARTTSRLTTPRSAYQPSRFPRAATRTPPRTREPTGLRKTNRETGGSPATGLSGPLGVRTRRQYKEFEVELWDKCPTVICPGQQNKQDKNDNNDNNKRQRKRQGGSGGISDTDRRTRPVDRLLD